MKLLKNKFFIAAVVIALIICIIPMVFTLIGKQDVLRSAVNVAAKPFRAAANWVVDGISGIGQYFSRLDALIKENEQLRAELESYRQAAGRAELNESENDRLRLLLGFTEQYREYTLKDARVIGRSSNSYSVTFTLDRGSESGIEKNMAVITPSGIAGYVKESGLGYCRVAALTDPTAAVGVYTAEGIYGTVEGSVRYRGDGLCIMDSSVSGLQNGTMLYSSGYGNIFPPDMPVGKIISAERDEFGHLTTYIIEPTVDFDKLTTVMIVTAKDVTEGQAGDDSKHEK